MSGGAGNEINFQIRMGGPPSLVVPVAYPSFLEVLPIRLAGRLLAI